MSATDVDRLMNKHSGFLGTTGESRAALKASSRRERFALAGSSAHAAPCLPPATAPLPTSRQHRRAQRGGRRSKGRRSRLPAGPGGELSDRTGSARKHGCIPAACTPLPPTFCRPAVPQVYLRRIREHLGSFLVTLGGQVDAVVFSAGEKRAVQCAGCSPCTALAWTACNSTEACLPRSTGVGENGSMIRELALSGLGWAGECERLNAGWECMLCQQAPSRASRSCCAPASGQPPLLQASPSTRRPTSVPSRGARARCRRRAAASRCEQLQLSGSRAVAGEQCTGHML